MRVDSAQEATKYQVSHYIKERKVLKYIKENLISLEHGEKYESKVLNAPTKNLEELYEKITDNPKITLAELLPYVIKENKRNYAR